MYANRNLRVGLSQARSQAYIDYLPRIVKSLRDPNCIRAFAGNPFPKKFSQFPLRNRLESTSREKEFIWSGSILSLFVPELARFVQYRSNFCSAFIGGDLVKADEILYSIEVELGVSIWLIENRLRLLQLTSGLSAQKTYLESILSTKGLNTFAAHMAYYFSVRSEENVSLASLESELAGLIDEPVLGDYARYHVIPYHPNKLRDIANPILVEESQTIIDRFETHVAMAQLGIARYGVDDSSYILSSLELIRDVNDDRIKNILWFTTRDSLDDYRDGSAIKFFDAYTEGRYEEALSSLPDLFELNARSTLQMDRSSVNWEELSLASRITSAMRDILFVSADYQKATLFLKKMALFCAHHDVANHIVAFIERTHEHVLVKSYTELDRLGAVCGRPDNPWICAIFADITANDKLLDKLIGTHINSSSIRLQQIFTLDEVEGNMQIANLPVPDHRRSMYFGHFAFKHGRYSQANKYYQEAAESDNQYISNRAKAYLFKSMFAEGALRDCLSHVVIHCLSNPNAFRLYPLDELAEAALKVPELLDEFSLAVLLHIASRYGQPRWERDLSDVYENAMLKVNVLKPSELTSENTSLNLEQLVFFLRFVCVPRILDDITSFDTLFEVEEERIAICQLLIDIDPENSTIYSSEIRSITRDANVAQLLQQVEASKIYVDEEGVRKKVEETLRDSFARYQKLLKSPDLDNRAEKISKILGTLFSSSEILKPLRLPATEREGLFSMMLHDFVSQFALNPAFGLDTHLSTAIRHGEIEGHIRNPFATYDLLCSHDDKASKTSNEYILPGRWNECFCELQPNELQHVKKQMGRFTSKVEEVIDYYRKELLHVRTEDTFLKGAFNFYASHDSKIKLMEGVTVNTTYDEFVGLLMAHCWGVTDSSMEMIKLELSKSKLQVNQAIDTLISSIETQIAKEKVSALSDAAVRAKTEFQVAVDGICGWFKRPTDVRRDPFEFEIAVGVAQQQIRNCYVASNFSPRQQINVHNKILGELLDGTVEILYLLFQNTIRHSGFGDIPSGVTINACLDNKTLEIIVKNDLAKSVNLDEHRKAASDWMSRHREDTALKMARKEGGSGLSKVWRILHFDLKMSHSLKLMVNDDYTFCAQLIIWDIGVLE
ncbi:conserved hypothetical protein [Candidatus Nitrotoga sp. M5]|nr:conserved hypothetical protein [Candidatus Nitrotoga sp. M5]